MNNDANQQQRDEVARHVDRLADQLRHNADRIARYAQQLRNGDRQAASVVADLLSDYEQMGTGPIIWQMISGLAWTRPADAVRPTC